jgi:hypothetical protein
MPVLDCVLLLEPVLDGRKLGLFFHGQQHEQATFMHVQYKPQDLASSLILLLRNTYVRKNFTID